MIRHISLFTFKEGIGESARTEAIQRLQAVDRQYPDALERTIGIDQSGSPGAADVAEIVIFGNEAAMGRYRANPERQELTAHLATLATCVSLEHVLPL